ncbi:MAG TPA: glycosyltransferase family 4 protein [Puia sp.]|nr:glycosyltransferase family 4 protein [Puia sp.]
MKFVSLSYQYSGDIDNPEDWFRRVRIYTGSWKQISREHEVIRVEQINFEGKISHEGIQYHFVNYGKKKLYFPWRLHRFIASLDPDIVMVNGLHFPLQLILLRLQLPGKIKIIAQNHAEKPFGGLKKYWQRWADQCINAYLFASRMTGESWVKNGNLSSEKKIHEVMEVSSVFRPMERSEARSATKASGSPVYLWVGRLDANKDPVTVIKAFVRFLEFHPSARLYMIYHTKELLSAVRGLIPEENKHQIIQVGRMAHCEMQYWYNSADFIVSGSHYEGSGTAVCEAMSCGCIPVLTNIDSFRVMTNQGACGLLYEKGNPEDLLGCLVQTIYIDRSVYRKRTLAQFQSALSFEAIAKKIQTIASSL